MKGMFLTTGANVHLRDNMEVDNSSGSAGNLLDENLVMAEEVAGALAEDSRTASSGIEVVFEHGVITLMGDVESELAHSAAEEIAHRHEGVLSVVNALEVRPISNNLDTIASVLGQLVTHGYGAVTDVNHLASGH